VIEWLLFLVGCRNRQGHEEQKDKNEGSTCCVHSFPG
jgi:hypothetical protein